MGLRDGVNLTRSCTSTLRVGEVVLILYLAILVLVPLLSCVIEFYTFLYWYGRNVWCGMFTVSTGYDVLELEMIHF